MFISKTDVLVCKSTNQRTRTFNRPESYHKWLMRQGFFSCLFLLLAGISNEMCKCLERYASLHSQPRCAKTVSVTITCTTRATRKLVGTIKLWSSVLAPMVMLSAETRVWLPLMTSGVFLLYLVYELINSTRDSIQSLRSRKMSKKEGTTPGTLTWTSVKENNFHCAMGEWRQEGNTSLHFMCNNNHKYSNSYKVAHTHNGAMV